MSIRHQLRIIKDCENERVLYQTRYKGIRFLISFYLFKTS